MHAGDLLQTIKPIYSEKKYIIFSPFWKTGSGYIVIESGSGRVHVKPTNHLGFATVIVSMLQQQLN